MNFFRRFSPLRAFRDLRAYLQQRQPYELGFMFLSFIITVTLIGMLIHDSRVQAPPKEPEIIYVQSWPLNRTDAQIAAAAKVNDAKKKAAAEKLAKMRAERRAEFQRLDNQLDAWGL
ncbi:hypothetical protein [Stakelama marina]|uniref:Uncharacterized protein n=1 Tax=Stakelama marina TaxID=2826939 RepID=A0A8T4IF44_9SPHN|nr:hypothetical protein [Stakelama marina]MBR0553180.1 hypothetical protein [Stakelama marina]